MRAKYTMDTFPAYEVCVEMEGDIQEYAMNFLKIFNTVKSNKDDLFRITNDYGNGVQVVCNEESLEATKEYLSNFGKIKYVNKVLCASIEDDIDCDYDTYDDVVIVPYID